MKFIDKVGLEVEGGWDGEPFVAPFDDLDLHVDRSIDGTMAPIDRRMTSVHVGEAISPPIEREAVEEWINQYWPKEANSTCGYHIHVSLKKPWHYILLTRKIFFMELLDLVNEGVEERSLPRTHYLRQRLAGNNPFCLLDFDAAAQIEVRLRRNVNRVRYGALNFAHGIHGTVEFRLYPTFKKKNNAVFFTNLYLDFVERHLEEVHKLSWKRSISLAERYGKNVIQKGVV